MIGSNLIHFQHIPDDNQTPKSFTSLNGLGIGPIFSKYWYIHPLDHSLQYFHLNICDDEADDCLQNPFQWILDKIPCLPQLLENVQRPVHISLATLEYCQVPLFSKFLSHTLFRENSMDNIPHVVREANPFRWRYRNNHDIFLHVRQGDIQTRSCTPPLEYYQRAISKLKSCFDPSQFGTFYLASDTPKSQLCQTLCSKYHMKSVNMNPIQTILFGSTCRHTIVGTGTFSYMIGLFAFYSDSIYYCHQDCIERMNGHIFDMTPWTPV